MLKKNLPLVAVFVVALAVGLLYRLLARGRDGRNARKDRDIC